MPERPIVCAPCVRRTLRDRRAELDEAHRAHAMSRARLERAVTATAGRDRAEGPRAALAAERERNAVEDLRRARAENARIESAIRDERDGLARAREALTARAAALATAQGKARENRWRMFRCALPDESRLQTLRLKHAREQLAVERARAVERLRIVFPIAVERVSVERDKVGKDESGGSMAENRPAFANAARPRPPPPTAVTVCGLRIPDPGDASPITSAREISAGLGVTLALLTLSASVLGAPLLHRGEFRGSESRVWTPGSFWDDEPEAAKPGGRTAGKLRLYLPEKYLPGDAGGEGGCPGGVPRGGAHTHGGSDDARGELDGTGSRYSSRGGGGDGRRSSPLTGALKGLNRGLDRVEAALQGVDGTGRVAAAVGRVAGGIGTVAGGIGAAAGGIGTGIGRVGAAVYETGERAATNVSRTALNLRPGTGAAVTAVTAVTGGNRAPAASRTNDPSKPRTPHKPGPINPALHPPVPIHPAEWSKQAEREAAAARARAELNAGIRLLHRSAGAICADAMPFLLDGARDAPEDWGPLATLALALATLARGAKKGGGFPDATGWVERRRLNASSNDTDGGTVSKTVSLGMRESVFLSPAISRAAHSGLTGAQSLMSSVFGGRPAGRTDRRTVDRRGVPTSSGTIGEDDDGDDWIRSPDLEYRDDLNDASSAMAESTWQLVDAPVGRVAPRDGVAAVSSRGRAAVLPPPPSKPEDVERWMRAMDLGGRDGGPE